MRRINATITKTSCLVLFCISITNQIAFAQDVLLDSLQSLYASTTNDREKVEILFDLVDHQKPIDRKKAEGYVQEALELSQRINYGKGASLAYYHLGSIEHLNGNKENALKWTNEALAKALEQKDLEMQAKCYLLFSSIYQDHNELKKAIESIDKTITIAEKLNNQRLLGESYHALARINNVMGEIEKAVPYLEKAIEIFEPLQDIKKLGSLYQGLATVTDGEVSFEHATKGKKYFEQFGDLQGVAFCETTLGAIKYEEEAYEEAIPYFEAGLQLFERIDMPEGISYTALNLATTYLELKRYDEAITYYGQSIKIATQLGYDDIKQLAFKGLAVAYASQSNADMVAAMIDSMETIRDTLYNREKVELLVSANERFNTKEKEAQIAQQELELQKQRRLGNTILLGAVIAILILLAVFQYFRYLQRLKRQETEAALQIKDAEAKKLRELDEVKSTFFANISHEFRTPLSLILGPVRNAIEQIPASEDLDEEEPIPVPAHHLQVMERHALRLQNLIDQLLDLSKLDSGKMKLQVSQGNIIQFIRSMVFSFESLAERKRIHLSSSFPEEIEDAYFDTDKLEKIIVNVLSNAFKFTPENGHIGVQVQRKKNSLTIVISDSGPGIAPENLDKIFDRFYQVKGDERQGSGIGLTLVKELVELHKGQISVESNKGKGTTFKISIPFSRTSFDREAFAASASRENQIRGFETVLLADRESSPQGSRAGGDQKDLPIALIVEDNPDLRHYIGEILQKDYLLHTANDGKTGLEKALKLIPDIIISDVMMPKMDGFEMCDALKKDERTSHIPIVLLTAKAGQRHKIEGLEMGADDYLTKPFHAKELVVRAKNLILQRRQLQEKFHRQLKIHPTQVVVNSVDERFLKSVMTEVENNIGNEFYTVEELARATGFSRSQLHRKLKALCDKSPNEIIRDFRLSRAKELLEQKAGNVSEVAYQVGYTNLSYFSRSFKKAHGVMPSEV